MIRRTEQSIAAEAAFRARLAELGAVLLEPAWLGALSPHRVRCAAGHDCLPVPNKVQQGQGVCWACSGTSPASGEAGFRARLTELGATLLESYHGANSPHRVRCAAGHDCVTRPGRVQQGHGVCRACAGKDPVMAESAFRARLAELGAVLLEPEWLGVGRPHRVRCAAGHPCSPQPGHVREGHGVCRTCTMRGGWDVFYVVADHDLFQIKFGITSGDPRPRLKVHRKQGYGQTVRLLTDLPAYVAPAIEGAVLATLRLSGLMPIRGREYYDASALALVLDVTDNYPAPEGSQLK